MALRAFIVGSIVFHLALLTAAQTLPRLLGWNPAPERIIEVGLIPSAGKAGSTTPVRVRTKPPLPSKGTVLRRAEAPSGPEAVLSEPDPDDPKAISMVSPEAERWFAVIRRRLEGSKTYPSEAAAARVEGEAVVEVLVRADGTVGHAVLVKSSGYPVLDAAALRLVRGAGPFPVPPISVKREPGILLRCPVKYRLHD